MEQKGEPPVVIIGGGMGGLVLARVLQRHGKPAVVYEAEGSREERDRQGGTLDMHEESGQWALAQVGGWVRREGRGLVRDDSRGPIRPLHGVGYGGRGARGKHGGELDAAMCGGGGCAMHVRRAWSPSSEPWPGPRERAPRLSTRRAGKEEGEARAGLKGSGAGSW